ncbi:MAG TPA: hypothetical protein PLW67_12825 [Prolixibacteraceae bacterium]|nr:hypothetical protein [Prolixibacteraceae bacterium]
MAFEYMPQSKVSKELVPDELIGQWLDKGMNPEVNNKIFKTFYPFL